MDCRKSPEEPKQTLVSLRVVAVQRLVCMLSEAHPAIRQFLRFCALPYCYVRQVDWRECGKSRWAVASDLLYIFFRLRYYPDNYRPCRLFEKPRSEWAYYYGSSYNPWARQKLRREVQPFGWVAFFTDKTRSEAHFRAHGIPMPRTFAVLDPSGDFRQAARNALRESRCSRLIMKPVAGAGGRGICMLVDGPDGCHVDTMSGETSLEMFRLSEKYLVQEILTQDERVTAIYGGSVNTIRVLTLLTRDGEVLVLSAVMRFGVGGAFVDNWSAGGIAVGVDHVNGRLMKWAFDKRGRRFDAHPKSGFRFEGFQVPCWSELLLLSERVQRAVPDYRLTGLDVALTPSGPKVIEVNANPDLVFQEQTAGPLLRDRRVLKEFGAYELLTNRYQRRLLPGESGRGID